MNPTGCRLMALLILFVCLLAAPSHAGIVVEYAGTVRVAREPVDITAADMDGDGDLDLVTANEEGDSFTILHNDGTGRFGDARHVFLNAINAKPASLAVADFNGDGLMDAAVGLRGELDITNLQWAENTSIQVMLAQPDGSYTSRSYPIHGIAGSLIAIDHNQDGFVDIVAGNLGHLVLEELRLELEWPGVNFFFNDGEGGFVESEAHFVETDGSVSPIEFTDLDGDGHLDIVAVNQGRYDIFVGELVGWNISILKNDGQGKLRPDQVLSTTTLPFRTATGDLDGDGDVDVVAAEWGSGDPEQQSSMNAGLGYWWNNGDGTFSDEEYVLIDGVPSAVSAVDLDGDGDLDLVVTNEGLDVVAGYLENPALMVFENNGSGHLSNVLTLTAGEEPRSMVVGDWDGDGDIDVAAASQANNTVNIYLNQTPGAPVTDWVIY